MKKIILSIAFVMMVVIASTQTDGFFKVNDVEDFDYRYNDGNGLEFALPAGHGLDGDHAAPLGTGLLILTALGAGYTLTKKRDNAF